MRMSNHPLVLALTLSMAMAAGACSGTSSKSESELELASNGAPPAGLANRTGIPITGAAEGLAADDDDEDSKDYWKDIVFGRPNFDEVRQQVQKRYIDPSYDETWAFAQAATFAVGTNEARPLMLFPEAFYKARKDDPREKGALQGKMLKISPSDGYVLLEESKAKVEDKSKKRLSDDEIRALRDWQMDRSRALHAAWDAIDFDKDGFDRVMDFVQREFAGAKGWTMKTAWVAAAQGYLYALDPHSSMVAKTAWDDSTKKTQDSSFEGIGAVLTQRPDSEYTIVESPIEGQPAVRAGLRAGDMIIAVDGKDIKGESLSKVVSRIRGPSGSPVVLTVQREGDPENKKLSITRSKIAMKNVQGSLVDKHSDIAVIKVTGFVKTTDDDLVAEVDRLEKLTKSGKLRGLVLDLRNNSGGLLNQGIKMGDRFIKDGIIVTVKNRNSSEDEVYKASEGDEWDFPMVVLVNDGSASAAEIVASALQDNQRAIVVGDRTFGKASVQTLFQPLLQDDYYIKMTVARYYAPSGRTRQLKGVVPDVIAPPEVDGKMPLGFREENLSGHLVPLDGEYLSANKAAAERAVACAAKNGIARKTHLADPNPAIKFDWQLNYGADILECSIAERAAARP